jgi:addiction module RelE/StbE family toxin
MTLRWSRQSRQHLRQIREYISREHLDFANHLRLAISDAVGALQRFPRLGRVGQRRGTRQLPVRGMPYIIVYRIRPGELVILGIFHSAQQR